MRSVRRGVLYGLIVWAVPFAISVVLFPLKKSRPELFESIMPVVLAVVVSVLGASYFRRVHHQYVREGILLGLLWLAMSIVIDLPLMLPPPIKMTLARYLADVGLTYVMIPAITIGMGLALQAHPEVVRQRLVRLDKQVEVPAFVPQL
jgi:hypothetical protein